MRAHLLSTVAVSLLIGIGAASAQSMNQTQAPERAPTAQQSAPAEKVAPPPKAGSTKAQSSTTGQGAAAGAAKLSSEQRTKITTVIKSQKVERVEPSKLNISINVGTRVPSSVRFHRLPTEVVTIYPEWRGYDYIMVGDQIVILDPRTHEIVFIIEA